MKGERDAGENDHEAGEKKRARAETVRERAAHGGGNDAEAVGEENQADRGLAEQIWRLGKAKGHIVVERHEDAHGKEGARIDAHKPACRQMPAKGLRMKAQIEAGPAHEVARRRQEKAKE